MNELLQIAIGMISQKISNVLETRIFSDYHLSSRHPDLDRHFEADGNEHMGDAI